MPSTNFALDLTKLAAKKQCWLSPGMVNFLLHVNVTWRVCMARQDGLPCPHHCRLLPVTFPRRDWVAASSTGGSGVSVS